jgi:hypothetical protein
MMLQKQAASKAAASTGSGQVGSDNRVQSLGKDRPRTGRPMAARTHEQREGAVRRACLALPSSPLPKTTTTTTQRHPSLSTVNPSAYMIHDRFACTLISRTTSHIAHTLPARLSPQRVRRIPPIQPACIPNPRRDIDTVAGSSSSRIPLDVASLALPVASPLLHPSRHHRVGR